MSHPKKNEAAIEPEQYIATTDSAPDVAPLVEPKWCPKVGDFVYYSCGYTSKIYAAIVACQHADDTYDLVVFDWTQNPPIVLRKGIRQGSEPGTFRHGV